MRDVALIVTHDREAAFNRCFHAIKDQVEHIYVLCHVTKETGPGYATELAEQDERVTAILCADLNDDVPVPNLYWLWNYGMQHIADSGPARVAVLNDDAVVPFDWFKDLSRAMDWTGAAAASSGPSPVLGLTHLCEDTSDGCRLNGFAFVTDSFRRFADGLWWWYGDNDFDWTCRRDGGVAFVGGRPVDHPRNGGTPVEGALAEIVAHDRELFEQKWGRLP